MSNWTEHLRGLAKIEKNVGKSVAFNDSASRIDELESKIENLEQQLKQQWVSVEDELPKMTKSKIWSDDDCIVATEYNFEIGRTKNGEWVNMVNQKIIGVTHWMTLPKPPTK